jgi:hypothetical protein
MKRRTLADWKKLIELQAQSRLSIAAFCKQNKLTPSNFYKFRNKLNPSKPLGDFVKAERISIKPLASAQILLPFGETTLTVSDNCDPHWLARLIKALYV